MRYTIEVDDFRTPPAFLHDDKNGTNRKIPEMLPKDCFYIFRGILRGVRGRKRLNASLSGVYDNLCGQNCRLAIYKVKHIRSIDFLSFSPLLLIGSHSQELTCNDLEKERNPDKINNRNKK